MPTTDSKPLCTGAFPIPPSPVMISHGNVYFTCSKCGQPYQPDIEVNVQEDRLSTDSNEELVKILAFHDGYGEDLDRYIKDGGYVPEYFWETVEALTSHIQTELDAIDTMLTDAMNEKIELLDVCDYVSERNAHYLGKNKEK